MKFKIDVRLWEERSLGEFTYVGIKAQCLSLSLVYLLSMDDEVSTDKRLASEFNQLFLRVFYIFEQTGQSTQLNLAQPN